MKFDTPLILFTIAIAIVVLIISQRKSKTETFTTQNTYDRPYDRYYNEATDIDVLGDPFPRVQRNGIPVRAYNLKLTEKQLQDIPYIPRRIRPPHGCTGWNKNYMKNEIREIMDTIPEKPECEKQWIFRILGQPNEFY